MIQPFQYIQLLWLLLLVPMLAGVYFYAKRKKNAAFKRMGDPDLVKELTANYKPSSFPKKFFLSLAAMALILLSIATLRTETGTQQIKRNGIDVMIAIDVSNSMLAQDIKPNRLERAKQLLNRLIDKMGDNRVGLVVFAGKAYLQMPLTADHSAAKMYLSAATPQTVPTQGTKLGDALKMCYASFNSKEKKYKAVVLISDGEDHDEDAMKIAGQMAEEGVVINAVGIGSPEGAPIMDPATNQLKKDEQGNTVITKLNQDALADIATEGNGVYMRYTNTDAVVSELYGQLSTLDRRSVTDNSLINYKSQFQYLLGAALLFLLLELFISEIKRLPRRKLKVAASVLFICFGFTASAQTDKETIKKGNDAYKRNDYEAAIQNYDLAVKRNSANAAAQYNLGNALYKKDKKEEALAAYEKAETALVKPADKSRALYNKGVVQQSDKKQEECILTYKNALKLDPDNVSARHNLQIALKKQKEEQDKKDKEDKGGGGGGGDNQPKPQPSNLSKKDAEQKLEALMQKEKELQDKLHKANTGSPDRPSKDW